MASNKIKDERMAKGDMKKYPIDDWDENRLGRLLQFLLYGKKAHDGKEENSCSGG